MNKLTTRSLALAMLAIGSAVSASAAPLLSSPFLGVFIPGTNYDVSTRTLFGWLTAVAVLLLGIRVIAVGQSSADERSKEERDDKLRGAWIAFGSGLAVFGVLNMMGIVTLTDITSAINSF